MKNVLGVFFVFLGIFCQAQDPPDITLVFYLDENSEVGTLVGKVSATDPEGDPLTYSIVSGNEAGAFNIDTDEGEITVADQEQLDFETTPVFNLMVEADDGNGGMTNASITINLNDIIDENPLGFEEHGSPVKIFPNPVFNFLTVDLSELSARDLKVRIFSTDGKEVNLSTLESAGSTIQINCSSLVRGIYILRVESNRMIEIEQRLLVR